MPEPSLNPDRDLGPQPRRQNREVCVFGGGGSRVWVGDLCGGGGRGRCETILVNSTATLPLCVQPSALAG